jgi:hypothetical protein
MASQATRPSAEFINSIELRRRVSTDRTIFRCRAITRRFWHLIQESGNRIARFECEYDFATLSGRDDPEEDCFLVAARCRGPARSKTLTQPLRGLMPAVTSLGSVKKLTNSKLSRALEFSAAGSLAVDCPYRKPLAC